ncbi:MAG: MotA/TolQ/ExbB proton channel family protein [Bacteroidota bacterium]
MYPLLQIDTTSNLSGSGTSPVLFDFNQFIAGGWPMIPLALLLILAIFIFIERYRLIRKMDGDSEELLEKVRMLVISGKIEEAKRVCQQQDDAFSRMLHKGISRLGRASLKDIEGSIENVGKLEVYRMERRLSLLATIAGAGPMIGFLGTVLGMIKAFSAIVQGQGNAGPVELADGISQAMITTAFGLVVGILAFIFYNSLVAMVSKVIFKLELTSTSFIDLLQEPADA